MSKAKNALYKTEVFLVIAAIICSGYWLKCRMEINYFPAVSLSGYFPFKYLKQNKVIHPPGPGIIFQDSFDSFGLFSNWTRRWMREPGKVEKHFDSDGIDGSRCLLITSRSSGSWSCSHNKFVEVSSGDRFRFEARVKLHGDKPSAYAGVAAFDINKDVVSWNLVSVKTNQTGVWGKLEKTFIVPEGIKYINFKLSGCSSGDFRFDNIFFEKLN